MRLSIITLNYKKPQMTVDCLASVAKQYKRYIDAGDCEIIVVDNASGDDSVPYLRKHVKGWKNVRVVASDRNGGFGAGNNLGVAHAKGEYVLFLNNDTIVKDASAWEMIALMKADERIGAMGGILRNMDGAPQISSGKFFSPLSLIAYLSGFEQFFMSSPKASGRLALVDWIKGAYLLIQRKTFLGIGGFDEHIFMYTEDMELCMRLKKAGYQLYIYPHTHVLHKDNGSSNRTFAVIHITRNIPYVLKKHRQYGLWVLAVALIYIKSVLLVLIGKCTGNTYLSQTYAQVLRPR
jgi:hypothetical protein